MSEVLAPEAYTTWGILYARARKGADSRLIPFDLARKDFDALVIRSEGRCMVSGIPFDKRRNDTGIHRPFAPSLDRIDSALGYTANNVRLVCMIVNMALNDWGIEPLLRMARNITERERELYAATEELLQQPIRKRRLWSPAMYMTTNEYLTKRYGGYTIAHTRIISLRSRQYCEQNGIECTHATRPTRQRKDGTWGEQLVAVFPEGVLKTVCDKWILDTDPT